MKIRTVGLLGAFAMTLTSLTVWSVTPPGAFAEVAEARVSGAADRAPTVLPAPPAESWKLEGGTTLRVEGRLGHRVLAADKGGDTYVYVDVKAAVDVAPSTPAPINLAIVIDRSGSMAGKRLKNALDAARGMVARLRDGDVVSVVTYNTRTETLVAPTVVDASSRAAIPGLLEGIVATGDTCISCALEAGMDVLRGRDDLVKRMLLLSDGQATSGVRDVPGFRAIAGRARNLGCSISSLGVDVDYNERIMSAIAAESNGRHYFVENAAGLPRVFDQELQSLVKTVAARAELRVELGPGVELLQVFDRASRREGSSLVVPLGLFAATDAKTVLVKVRIPSSAEGPRDVARVSLTFDDLVAGAPGTVNGRLAVHLTADPAEVSKLDPLVAERLGRSETAAVLRDANGRFARGDVAGARKILGEQRRRLASAGTTAARAAPAAKKAKVKRDFDGQIAAVEKADQGFATPPPTAAAPPSKARPGKVHVKQNQIAADSLGL